MSASPLQLVQTAMVSRRERLWLAAGKKCHWCGVSTIFAKVNNQLWDAATIDHVIPRYKGGLDNDSNLVSACMRCNNRRNHEDIVGLKEGSLIGNYKVGQKIPSSNGGKPKYVALSGDDKRAIITAKNSSAGISTTQVHVEQRDQALKEIKTLRERVGALESDLHLSRTLANDKDAEIVTLKEQLEGTTISTLVRRRMAHWLLRGLPFREATPTPPPV